MSDQNEREQSQQDPTNNEASNAGESFHDEEAIAQAERELRMAQQGGEDPLEGLAERAKDNPDCVFDRRVLEAAVLQSEGEQAAHASLRRALKAAGIALGPFDAAVKKMAREMKERVEREQEERSRELAERQRAARIEQEAREREERERERRAAIEAAPWKEKHYAFVRVDDATYEQEPGRITARWTTNNGEERCETLLTRSLHIEAEYIEHVTMHDDCSRALLVRPGLAKHDGAYVLGRSFELSSFEITNGGWVVKKLGATARAAMGRQGYERLRFALQSFAEVSQPPMIDRFHFTGWARSSGGTVGFLTASGMLGPDGMVPDVEVKLRSPDNAYCLPLPDAPGSPERRAALQSLVDLLSVEPATVAIPLVLSAFRGVLGPFQSAVNVKGPKGKGKTTLASMVLGLFGGGLATSKLSVQLSRSEFMLWKGMHRFGGVPFPIDDNKNTGGERDKHTADKLESLIAPHFNGEFRCKGTAEGGERIDGFSRCVLWIIGEVKASVSESSTDRTIVTELSEHWGPNHRELLERARAGEFARGMAAFVQHIAATLQERDVYNLPAWRAELTLAEIAAGTAAGLSKRTAEVFGGLLLGLDALLSFLRSEGVLEESSQRALRARALQAILSAAEGTVQQVTAQNPVTVFLDLLCSAVAGGKAHFVATGKCSEPPNATAWGWRERSGPNGPTLEGGGERIGYLDSHEIDVVYIEPELAFSAVSKLARESGIPLALMQSDMDARLFEAGALARSDKADGKRKTHRVRKNVHGVSRNTLALRRSIFDGEAPTPPAQQALPASSSDDDLVSMEV